MTSSNQILLLIDVSNTEMSFTTTITLKKVLKQMHKHVLKTSFIGVESSNLICLVLTLSTFPCFYTKEEALDYLFLPTTEIN